MPAVSKHNAMLRVQKPSLAGCQTQFGVNATRTFFATPLLKQAHMCL